MGVKKKCMSFFCPTPHCISDLNKISKTSDEIFREIIVTKLISRKKTFILLCYVCITYRSSFTPNGVNCLLSDMSTSQLTENDLTRTSSSSDPDWDVFELNSNCDDPDNGGGGSLPGRNTDGE